MIPTAQAPSFSAPPLLIGQSPRLRHVQRMVEKLANGRWPALILGETGTGKEVVARSIHAANPSGNFVTIDCSAFVGTLMESELFGHRRGAFTGADRDKVGLIEAADGGTAFFDEIGEMPLDLQAKLLRVLQEKEFRPLGSTVTKRSDFRIIAATNRDLSKMVAEGTFREDLYYRVNVIPVALPALRERREDIPVLARHFVQRFAREMRRPGAELSADALEALLRHAWPGNIRELENVIERAVALEPSASITLASLPDHIQHVAPASAPPMTLVAGPTPTGSSSTATAFPAQGFDLERHVQDIEREYLAEALRRADGVKMRAAELLGMSFRSFRYYAKKYNL